VNWMARCRARFLHGSRAVSLIVVAGLESSLSSRRGLPRLAGEGAKDKASSSFSQTRYSYIGCRSYEWCVRYVVVTCGFSFRVGRLIRRQDGFELGFPVRPYTVFFSLGDICLEDGLLLVLQGQNEMVVARRHGAVVLG
jgi:hypothetical protein